MIKFFRHIRKAMIKESKASKYLLYAIGEIVLVVIGILIALQINNWNQNETNRAREIAILKDLNQEFKKNTLKLDSLIQDHRGMLEAANEIMMLIGEPENTLANHNVDSLIYLSIDYDDFNPSQSVIDEAIASGTISLIRSDSLRSLIFDWVSAMGGIKESYATMDEMGQTMTLPYLTKYGSMKNIDYFGLMEANGKSKFESRNPALFQEVEFENIMDNQAWGMKNYLNKLEGLKPLVDQIMHLTNREIEKGK
ncbi:DUF6090 family protein [Cryomorphaceae bacterium 1068]|nr:DUF6090 family protein [Cryomorphaceae bacterium 1068]